MREISVAKPHPKATLAANAVQRLQFDASGVLLSWVGVEFRHCGRRLVEVHNIRLHDPTSGEPIPLDHPDLGGGWASHLEFAASPDRRFAAYEFDQDPAPMEPWLAEVVDLTKPVTQSVMLTMGTGLTGGFAFTADGKTLLAARNNWDGAAFAADLVRLETEAVTRPPTRFRTKINPFTGQPYRAPVRNVKWKTVVALPAGSGLASSLAVSADGRLAAVGTRLGWVAVIDLKKKAVVLHNEWWGRRVHDRWTLRVGFDPPGEWVAMIANGRLFANTVKSGGWKEWQTKTPLGYLHDFAYHPGGEFVAVVDANGVARFLDPQTGKVKREFRWKRGPLYSVAFSPDGLVCAAGGGRGRVVLWDVDT